MKPDLHQRQILRPPQFPVVERSLPDALPHPLYHITLVMRRIPEQKVCQSILRFFGMAAENSQVFLQDLSVPDGSGQPAGDLPAAGEDHDAADHLVQPVDSGDVIALPQRTVAFTEQFGHGSAGRAVLREDTDGFYCRDQPLIFI
jgi:hypothetical protein